MKKFIITLFILGTCVVTTSLGQWKPIDGKITTKWSEQVSPENALPNYPRPIMERKLWQNLNGLWEYAIVVKGSEAPKIFDGKILVPFAVESSLSGVGKNVGAENELIYKRTFTIPKTWKNKKILLHFGAVDWETDVMVNGIHIGKHNGGFTPFSFDISEALNPQENILEVRVWDPTDQSYQPRGKQVSNPEGIWYTSVTGIWQTVWIEPVNASYIDNIRIIPDIDKRILSLTTNIAGSSNKGIVKVDVYDGELKIAEGKSIAGQNIQIRMPQNMKLWSPDFPFLYSLKISLIQNGEIMDKISSYAAMRKYSTKRDTNGIMRLELNNQPLFQFGLLDQGWWPDGLYTAPTDEAMAYDIKKTKDLGFNMIRKHIKVEPARWYTYCDKLGIIVWQDMPSGDKNPEWQNRQYFNGIELQRSSVSELCYKKEWKEIIDYLYSYPCIGTWIPFNEAWGQFKTPEIVEWTKQYDPTRLVDPASGGNHYTCGDILDLHNYPTPELYLYDAQRANVLGEYGGIGWAVPNHLWFDDKNWGYIQFNSSKEVTDEYIKYANKLLNLSKRGFSAAVYTQTTDVEGEVNGLMTYDRKVIKVEENRVKSINQSICHSLNHPE